MELEIEPYNKDYNILDYIALRGDVSFAQSPFNSVDALILSQLSYNNMEEIVPDDFNNKIKLSDVAHIFKNPKEILKRCNMGAFINPLTPRLLVNAGESERFGSINLCGFVNIIDEDKIEQFSAVTYELYKNQYLIVYRGTDDTVVAWYEDFNLGWMDEIPAQKDAALYAKKAFSTLKGSFSIAGHSKGGNLALKAGLSLEKAERKRLQTIYNFDGPGFYPEVLKSDGYLKIQDRIRSYYPQFCVVGMMFEHGPAYQIVRSSDEGILQHDPFGWNISGSTFQTEASFDETSRFVYESFNSWTRRLSVAERKRFIDVFFSVIYASGAKTNSEIDQNRVICGGKMLAKMAELTDSERSDFMRAVKNLIDVAKDKLPMINVFNLLRNKK